MPDLKKLMNDPDKIEAIEKATFRMLFRAVSNFRLDAVAIFKNEGDLAGDIGEDLTREALDSLGMSKNSKRLFGKVDYKRARYVFHPDFELLQALFVDSKAEMDHRTATIQLSQTSMIVKQIRNGKQVIEKGLLPTIISDKDGDYLVTTAFVKYHYEEPNKLVSIILACLPNGILQAKYNPDSKDTIWMAGRNAPTRGERFRVRLSFEKLREKAQWRVQVIPVDKNPTFLE